MATELKTRKRKKVPAHSGQRQKVVSLTELGDISSELRRQGKVIAHCHGVFDLLHIGHVWHLEQAKAKGDVLVVTVTPDQFVNKGPHRPAFPADIRARMLAALDIVDYVAVNQWPQAMRAISVIKPHYYVKGSDYRDAKKDLTGMIVDEEAAVKKVGGQIWFTDGQFFSSSALLNKHLPVQSTATSAWLEKFSQGHSVDDIARYVSNMKKLDVLVVGEAIIDEYQYCEAIGKSSKEPTLVVKKLSRQLFAGGVLAIGNHMADFTKQTTIITQLGDRLSHQDFIARSLNQAVILQDVTRRGAPTIVKRRYVDKYFLTKLFETYDINDEEPSKEDEAALCHQLKQAIGAHDMVVVADYGHGMFSPPVIETIRREAQHVAVNVQSNAGNFGYQSLRKHKGANHISVDENELRLEARDRRGDIRHIMQEVIADLDCDSLIVTRGKYGCLCYRKGEDVMEVPAFTGKVVDRVGAGDAFLSVTALGLAQDMPLEVIGFLGNAAGSQAVAMIGNSQSLHPVSLIRYAESLLK